MPHRSSVVVGWRLKMSRYKFIGSRCGICNKIYFPMTAFCKACSNSDIMQESHLMPEKLSENGLIETFTVIRTAPAGFEHHTPYIVAIIKLDEGPMISAQVVNDVEDVEIGKKVKCVFRRLNEADDSSIINYGFKFEIDE